MSNHIFGWDLPPGCSMRDIENALGVEEPLDCPVCVDGVELDGPDCTVDANHGPTCPKHGCVTCGNLEKQRVYCGFCGDYLRVENPVVERNGAKFCSETCAKEAYGDVIEHEESIIQQTTKESRNENPNTDSD